MAWNPITEHYFVTGQISVDDIKEAARQGFEVIMCNRPDGETPDQPNYSELQAAAEAEGLQFLFMPMVGPNFDASYLPQVNELVDNEKKVLAYCRTGNRCTILFNAAQAAR